MIVGENGVFDGFLMKWWLKRSCGWFEMDMWIWMDANAVYKYVL